MRPVGRVAQRPGDGRGRIPRRQGLLDRQAPPAGFGRQNDHAFAVRDQHGILQPGPGALVFHQIHADDDHAQQLAFRTDRAGIGEIKPTLRPPFSGKDGFVLALGIDHGRLVLAVFAQEIAVGRRNQTAGGVHQLQPGHADLVTDLHQPLGRAGIIAILQRLQQVGIGRDQQRHHRGALQFGQEIAGIKRQPQLGAGAGDLGKAVAQQAVGDQHHAHGQQHQQHHRQLDAPPQPLARRAGRGLRRQPLQARRQAVSRRRRS